MTEEIYTSSTMEVGDTQRVAQNLLQGAQKDQTVEELIRNLDQEISKLINEVSKETPLQIPLVSAIGKIPFEPFINSHGSAPKLTFVNPTRELSREQLEDLKKIGVTHNKSRGLTKSYGMGSRTSTLSFSDIAISSKLKNGEVYTILLFQDSDGLYKRKDYTIDGETYGSFRTTDVFNNNQQIRKELELDRIEKATGCWYMFTLLGRSTEDCSVKKQDTHLNPFAEAYNKTNISWVRDTIIQKFFKLSGSSSIHLSPKVTGESEKGSSGGKFIRTIPEMIEEAVKKTKGRKDPNDPTKLQEARSEIVSVDDSMDILYYFVPLQYEKGKKDSWMQTNSHWRTGSIPSGLVYEDNEYGISEIKDWRLKTKFNGIAQPSSAMALAKALDFNGASECFGVFVILKQGTYETEYPYRTKIFNVNDPKQEALSLLSHDIKAKLIKHRPTWWKSLASEMNSLKKQAEETAQLDKASKFFKSLRTDDPKPSMDKSKTQVDGGDFKIINRAKPRSKEEIEEEKKRQKANQLTEEERKKRKPPRKKRQYANTTGEFSVDPSILVRPKKKPKHPNWVMMEDEEMARDQLLITDEKRYPCSYSSDQNTIYLNPFCDTFEEYAQRAITNGSMLSKLELQKKAVKLVSTSLQVMIMAGSHGSTRIGNKEQVCSMDMWNWIVKDKLYNLAKEFDKLLSNMTTSDNEEGSDLAGVDDETEQRWTKAGVEMPARELPISREVKFDVE